MSSGLERRAAAADSSRRRGYAALTQATAGRADAARHQAAALTQRIVDELRAAGAVLEELRGLLAEQVALFLFLFSFLREQAPQP